jgi:hypothetical protein
VDADTDTDSQPGEAEDDDDLPERDGFGPLMWFAVLFVLAAIGYVGYTMMLDSQRRAADPSSSNDAPETAPDREPRRPMTRPLQPTRTRPLPTRAHRFPTACRARTA